MDEFLEVWGARFLTGILGIIVLGLVFCIAVVVWNTPGLLIFLGIVLPLGLLIGFLADKLFGIRVDK